MAKTRECCSALSLRRTGDDLHVSLHKGFKIRLAGIVPVSLEFTDANTLWLVLRFSNICAFNMADEEEENLLQNTENCTTNSEKQANYLRLVTGAAVLVFVDVLWVGSAELSDVGVA